MDAGANEGRPSTESHHVMARVSHFQELEAYIGHRSASGAPTGSARPTRAAGGGRRQGRQCPAPARLISVAMPGRVSCRRAPAPAEAPLPRDPLPTATQQRHERLDKATALAVFASDPLSSVAYATEEIPSS